MNWFARLLGWGSPSAVGNGAGYAFAAGIAEAEALDAKAAAVPVERVEALRRLYALSGRLKKIEGCAASRIEGRPCVVRDVRWSGRELKRLLDATTTEDERWAVWRAEMDGALENLDLTKAGV